MLTGPVDRPAPAPESAEQGHGRRRVALALLAVGLLAAAVLIGVKIKASPGAAGASAESMVQLTVDSRQHWTDTGLVLRAGQVVRLSAAGNVSDDRSRPNQEFDPNGAERDPVNGVHSADPELSIRHAALIGRLEETGRPFFVGRALRIDTAAVPGQVGRLFLGINDSDVSDNTGVFAVTVSVSASAPR